MLTMHRHALAAATDLLGTVGPADLARPTPCAGWDLRTLIGHMVGQNHGFAAAATGAAAPVSAYADRPPEGWTASVAALTEAFATAPADRTVLLVEINQEQRFPLATAVGFHLLDTVVHTWDVATALGVPFRPGDELLAATAAQARLVPTRAARERQGAAFAPPVEAVGGDTWTTTLALLGR